MEVLVLRAMRSEIAKAAAHDDRQYDAAELAGLGLLAVPSVAELAEHKVPALGFLNRGKTKAALELGGLGTLAAPAVHRLVTRPRENA